MSYRGAVPQIPARREQPRPADVGRRAALSLAAGLALALAFPTHNLYWLAPVGVALLSAAVLGASWRLAGPLGLTAGLAFFVPTLSWSGVYVGALPWIALCVLQSLYIAAMSALTAAVQRPLLATRLRPLAYAAVPVFWVLQETARAHTPFGGFPWARLAFSQADSPLAHLAAYAGAPGVTAAVASLGVLLHAGVSVLLRRAGRAARTPGLGRSAPALGGALLAVAALPALAAPLLTPPTGGRPVDVMFVQGNVPKPGAGLQRRAAPGARQPRPGDPARCRRSGGGAHSRRVAGERL